MKESPRLFRLVILYKLTRAVVSLLLSALLAGLAATGRTALIDDVAIHVRHHATSAWSIELANLLVAALTPQHLWMLAGAMALDGSFTLVEWWALDRTSWGPWLVVIATGAFLPFEVVALMRHADVGRALLLALNVTVALYLARRARRAAS